MREHELWRHALEAARGGSVSVNDIKRETGLRDYLRDRGDKVAHRDALAHEWQIVAAARDGIAQLPPLSTKRGDARLAVSDWACGNRVSPQFFIRQLVHGNEVVMALGSDT